MKELKDSDVVAVDLDGTLADDSVISMTDYHPELIGEPIPMMVKRVKKWLELGNEIVIFTARVHPRHGLAEVALSEKAIREWCQKVFGREFEVTCMKDPMYKEIWDDKVVRIVKNEGIVSSQVDVDDPLIVQDISDPIGSFFT